MSEALGWPDARKPGVPLNPDENRAHMLRHKETGETSPALWLGGAFVGSWLDGDGDISPSHAASFYDYLGPCHTPAEVSALVEAARREGEIGAFAAGARSMRTTIEIAISQAARDEEVAIAERLRALPKPGDKQ